MAGTRKARVPMAEQIRLINDANVNHFFTLLGKMFFTP